MKLSTIIKDMETQHQEIVKLIDSLGNFIPEGDEIPNMLVFWKLICKLYSDLDYHLTIEDQLLYPTLKLSENMRVRSMAIQFQIELKSISNEFVIFRNKWDTRQKIADDLYVFLSETKAIKNLLIHRIHKEDEELYSFLKTLDTFK